MHRLLNLIERIVTLPFRVLHAIIPGRRRMHTTGYRRY